MTTTSGPGISLMQEQIGLAYYAEIPCVILDVQRVGPSTGLPTRTQQADIKICYYASHGDTKHPIFLPATPDEAFEFGWRCFDASDGFQTPVFVLTDLDLGMNLWPSDPLQYPTADINRGKLLDDEGLKQVKDFARYRDVDGDGIPYRTAPGVKNPSGVWFSRGTAHDEHAKYSEKPDVYKKNVDRLARKFEGFRNSPLLPRPVIEGDAKARIGFIAFGTTHNPLQEARGRLAAQGIPSEYLRLRSLPFGKEVEDFIARHEYVYVVEQNRDGQLAGIIRAERPALAAKVRRLNVYDGYPPAAEDIVREFHAGEKAGLAK
jgi:2-oxoglutarate ferredoxin oxidoreductase subunit alpha